MKDFIVELAFLLFFFIILPLILIYSLSGNLNDTEGKISVYFCEKDEVNYLDIEEYIVNVVAAEMPAVFSDEALKAQAVAARTYAKRKINTSAETHKGADLCTDFAHCQAYIDNESLKKNWGDEYESNIEKIKKAVEDTSGEFLSYNGECAMTAFHACSDGTTERASDVWGGEVPYLVCVESPGDLEKRDYMSSVSVTNEEFKKKLKEETGTAPDNNAAPIGAISLTEGGNVETAEFFGIKIKGTDVRKLFGLKSSSFTVEYTGDAMVFNVCGSGHGVGMSQYGAEAMGKRGKSYAEILAHYYPGTVLEKLSEL